MPKKSISALAAAVAVLFLSASTAAAEPIHLRTPSTVVTDGGSNLRLPPGYFLDEPTWHKLDDEVRRLQDSETSLKAQVEVYQKHADALSGWWIVAGAFAAGVTAGIIATR